MAPSTFNSPKKTQKEFLEWFKGTEGLPSGLDYEKTFGGILENWTDLFVNPSQGNSKIIDEQEDAFIALMDTHLTPSEKKELLDQVPPDEKEIWKKECDWSGTFTGALVLIPESRLNVNGGPSSNTFIKNFRKEATQKKVVELLLCSFVAVLKGDLGISASSWMGHSLP